MHTADILCHIVIISTFSGLFWALYRERKTSGKIKPKQIFQTIVYTGSNTTDNSYHFSDDDTTYTDTSSDCAMPDLFSDPAYSFVDGNLFHSEE